MGDLTREQVKPEDKTPYGYLKRENAALRTRCEAAERASKNNFELYQLQRDRTVRADRQLATVTRERDALNAKHHDWWCETCQQGYFCGADKRSNRATCPKCGYWMLSHWEHQNDLLTQQLAAAHDTIARLEEEETDSAILSAQMASQRDAAQDEARRLKEVLSCAKDWYSSVDDTQATQRAIDNMRNAAREAITPPATEGACAH